MLFIDHMNSLHFAFNFSAVCLYGAITRNKTINAGVFHVASIACMIAYTVVRNSQVRSRNRQKSREWKKAATAAVVEKREKNVLQTRSTDHLHSFRWRDKSKSHCTAKKSECFIFFIDLPFDGLPSPKSIYKHVLYFFLSCLRGIESLRGYGQ